MHFPLEKLAAQIPLPSTSSAIDPGPMFNNQLMPPTSSPNSFQQAMANSILSQNPFFNPAFQLAAFGPTADFNGVRQWFQQNTPYTSPLASNAPSIANLSALSLFTNDSTLTLNSQLGPKSKLIKKEEFDISQSEEWVKIFINFFHDSDDMVLKSLKSLKMFIDAIMNKKIPMNFDAKEFRELIELMFNRLDSSKEQKLISQLLDILATTSSSEHFRLVVRSQPIKILQLLVNLLIRAGSPANNWNNHQIVHLLRTFHNSLPDIKDKSASKNDAVFTSLLNFLKNSHTSVQFFALGILRVLMNGQDHWKKFITDRQGMRLILKSLAEHENQRFIRQAMRALITLVDSENTNFATEFVRMGGIDIIVSKMDICSNLSLDDLFFALFCLKLVSDMPTLANIEMTRAIHFALKCTLPLKISKTEMDIYWRNFANALGFLRNVLTLNEQARNYLASLDQGKSIPHLVGLATQSFDLIMIANHTEFTINANLKKPEIEINPKREKLLAAILEDCLSILAVVNKENSSGKITQEQQMASRKLADDESAMFLYQLVLNLHNNMPSQTSVLKSLLRIVNAGAMLAIGSRNLRIAETLLKFLFNPDTNVERLRLMKLAAEVLTRLVSEPSRLHLSVITPLLLNTENYQPFKLLDSFKNNTELYLAILKLIKELCQREPNLKFLWFHNGSNVDLLKYLKATSDNQEIVNLCSKIFDMLQMQMEEDTSESTFYDIFTQGIEMDQSGLP